MEQITSNVGLCKDCNYPLRDLPSNRCPECGREFNPNSPVTMNMGRPLGPVSRWILGPIGWPAIVVSLWPMTDMWEQASRQGLYYMGGSVLLPILSLGLIAVLHGFWLWIRSLTARHMLQRPPEYDPPSLRLRRRMIVLLLALAITVPLQVPLYIRFALSKQAMDRFAQEYINDRASLPPGGRMWVGLYELDLNRSHRAGGDLRVFWITQDVEAGFAYSPVQPDDLPINYGDWGHLFGSWYWFSED